MREGEMRFSMRWKFGWSGFALVALTLGCVSSSGQATPGWQRTAGLSVFGGASLVQPDYGTKNDFGFVIGGDYSRIFKPITISLEPRYSWSSGDLVTQTFFMINLKLERPFGRKHDFHPYAEAGVGRGTMHLGHPILTSQVSSPSEVIDGGLDYDITSVLGVKAEYQYHFWDFGYYSNGLNPHGPTVGLYYRLDNLSFHRRH
jgi:hypothetical protein